MKSRALLAVLMAVGIIVLLTANPMELESQQKAAVAIDGDDIGGVVTSAKGPEAGVWVIAETTDLPTRYAKMVVTDDQGRYLVPDLPKATYNMWVRGYGLVDSPKVKAAPGKVVNLKAVIAPNEAAAARYPNQRSARTVSSPANTPGIAMNNAIASQVGCSAVKSTPVRWTRIAPTTTAGPVAIESTWNHRGPIINARTAAYTAAPNSPS